MGETDIEGLYIQFYIQFYPVFDVFFVFNVSAFYVFEFDVFEFDVFEFDVFVEQEQGEGNRYIGGL